MMYLWLIKIGEISLKKGNRAFFERRLKENIEKKLAEVPDRGDEKSRLLIRSGRYYLETDFPDQIVTRVLETSPGVVAFSKAFRVEKNFDALSSAAKEVVSAFLSEGGGLGFKVEARRSDKSLPFDSYDCARELGHRLLDDFPSLHVDVHKPDFIVYVELREWGYVYLSQKKGPGGLPSGSSGKGMLLLSAGIDSPVAAYLMAKRGMKLSVVHFYTPPYTSEEAHDKVLRLASLIAPYSGGLTFFSLSFSSCQLKINQSVDKAATTLQSRAAMLKIAENCALLEKAEVLITGESLGQVASQTLRSLIFTDGMSSLPIFRPLIGLDKEEIIRMARAIGTYETSIEPFDDCCALFSPTHPLTRADPKVQREVFEGIEGLVPLMQEAIKEAKIYQFDAWGKTKKEKEGI